MDEKDEHIVQSVVLGELIFRALDKQELSEVEWRALTLWLASSPSRRVLFDQVMSRKEIVAELRTINEKYDGKAAAVEIFSKLGIVENKKKRKPAILRSLVKASVAAAVLLAVVCIWYFNSTHVVEQQVIPVIVEHKAPRPADIDLPTLTLGDGSSLSLDSNVDKTIPQSNSTASQSGNQLTYSPNAGDGKVVFNTLTVPRGQQFKLELQDGTKVWLNAASSIRYPTTFPGLSREVEITGEAFFEVASKPYQPFIVKAGGGQEIQVLGTQFNINAYKDEPAIKTTLLKGRVKLIANGEIIMSPGDQVSASDGKITRVEKNVDLNAVSGWRFGLFNFEGLHLKEAMRQLARWYDIEVVYEEGVPDIVLGGKILRKISLQDLIQVLNDVGVDVRLEGGIRLVVLAEKK